MIKFISVPLVILGVVLSTLHQSSLGSLYLSVPGKLYPLWYSPFLPVFFYISAIAAGLAMTIFEARHSAKAFGRAMHLPILSKLASVLAVILAFFLVVRFNDLRHREVLSLLWVPRMETYLFWLEIGLSAVGAGMMFLRPVRRCGRRPVRGFAVRDLRFSGQPAERQLDGHGSGLGHALHSEMD